MANDIIKFGPLALSTDGAYFGINIVTGEGYGERRTGIFIRADHAVDALGQLDEESGDKVISAFGQRLMALEAAKAAYGSLEREYTAEARKFATESTVSKLQQRLSLQETLAARVVDVEATESVDEPAPRKSARSTKKSD